LLASECQVFPQFCEFLIDFRWKFRETEVGPPRIRFHPVLKPMSREKASPGFGTIVLCIYLPRTESNSNTECAYIVRFIEFTNRPEKPSWSLRQFALYHRFINDGSDWCSTWILAGSSQRTEKCFDDFFRTVHDPRNVNPFELHVIFHDLAIASWRPYLAFLHESIVALVRHINPPTSSC
jgi:hypothetical protein